MPQNISTTDTRNKGQDKDAEESSSPGAPGAASKASSLTGSLATDSVPASLNALAVASQKFRDPNYKAAGYGTRLLDEVMNSLSQLAQHMNIRMLYWPDDHFVSYPEELLERIQSAGVFPEEPLRLDFPPSVKEDTPARLFHKHTLVSGMTETQNRILQLLLQPVQV
jgi:hypothetical protein